MILAVSFLPILPYAEGLLVVRNLILNPFSLLHQSTTIICIKISVISLQDAYTRLSQTCSARDTRLFPIPSRSSSVHIAVFSDSLRGPSINPYRPDRRPQEPAFAHSRRRHFSRRKTRCYGQCHCPSNCPSLALHLFQSILSLRCWVRLALG